MKAKTKTVLTFKGEDIINHLLAEAGILPEDVTRIRIDIKESGHPDRGDYKRELNAIEITTEYTTP